MSVMEPVAPGPVIVVAGGPRPRAVPSLPPGAWVVAADSGVDHARALGLPVHAAVGDFDSVSPEGLAWARGTGARVTAFPAAKNETDLELALAVAMARPPTRLVVLGAMGGRPDHHWANLSLLSAPAYAAVPVTVYGDDATVHVVRDAAELRGEPGAVVSLLPVHGSARGVRTDGLRYPLRDEDLPQGTPRGMSNVLIGRTATVRVRSGVLLAVLPTAD